MGESRHRVLLIEDDASLRRFVAMALEDLDIELQQCASVAPALALLREGSFSLILTDIMMPGESGFDLLNHLRRDPRLAGAAKVAVLSAGLTPAVREKLADLSVWRLLSKPVSVRALLACVDDAIAEAQVFVNSLSAPGALMVRDDERSDAVREYFAGNQQLFDAYRSACINEFRHDLQVGDAALAALDLQALRRLAHSLKSVLLTLGEPRLSAQARRLEDASHAGLQDPARELWAELRAGLMRIRQDD